ncbi:MAG: cation diffusion facilitator family transporter [Oscillospiraceae bacterium]|nr:cation diffusion facilitator family transporter [Oscillospiraceae bacterium]
MEERNEQIAMRVSVHTIIVNVALTIIKLFAGIFGRSSAMVSDAMHSLSDVFSTIIVIIGIKLSNQEPDKKHPYGHERFECVATIVLSLILFFTGLGIGWVSVEKIIYGNHEELAIPNIFALLTAVLSIAVKEGMYWYTRFAAKKIDSGALLADAWHHRSDAFSSIGSFAGILGAQLGFPILDSVASMAICLLILKVSFDIFKDSIGKMTDSAADSEIENQILDVITAQESVIKTDLLLTRMFGSKIYVEVEIGVDGTKSLEEAHDIAQRVHDAIETKFCKVKHCTVHVNPCDTEAEIIPSD